MKTRIILEIETKDFHQIVDEDGKDITEEIEDNVHKAICQKIEDDIINDKDFLADVYDYYKEQFEIEVEGQELNNLGDIELRMGWDEPEEDTLEDD